MAGIIELHSLGMDKEHLVGVVARAKKVKGFKAVSGNSADLEFSVNKLGDLGTYVVEDRIPIAINTDLIESPVDQGLFWKILMAAEGKVSSCVCYVNCSESESGLDVNHNYDVRLSFGISRGGGGGGLVSIIICSESKGLTDLGCRYQLIDRFIEVVGLQDLLKANVSSAGKLEVVSQADAIRDANGVGQADRRVMLKQGFSLFSSQWTDSLGVGDLTIYLSQKRDMLVEASKRLMESGALGRPVAYKVVVGVNQEHYPAVKDTLNESPYGPWQVELTAKSKYTLKNLDKAVKETDYFSFRAFTFKPKGIGEVAAELTYRDGLFYLNFLWEVGENEKFKQLETLVTELLGGEEFLDPSEY